MKQKTFLFFTVEPGIAHITRSLAIAEELKRRGHRVIFAITKTKQEFIKKAGIETVDVAESLWGDNLAKSIERLKDKKFVSSLIRNELAVLTKYKPDCALVDLRPSAIVSCEIANVPIVFISGSAALPYGCYLPNPGMPDYIHNLSTTIIPKLFWLYRMPYIRSLTDSAKGFGTQITPEKLFRKMHYLVPEVKGYLPAIGKKLPISYVGPIFWQGFDRYIPSWFKRIHPTGKTIYISFGGTGFDRQKLVNLSTRLADKGYIVVVSASTIAPVSAFPKRSNLYVAQYLSGVDITKRVDAVICHGGYGTMMQAIINGKPVLAIPFNPDQLLHALRFQELGLGRCVTKLSIAGIVRYNWQSFQEAGVATSIDKIITILEQMLENRNLFYKSIRKFQSQIPEGEGSERAAEVIEKVMENQRVGIV